MYESLTAKLTGVSPLLMHNGRLANPFDKIAKEIKAITDKKKKIDSDHLNVSSLEWLGSLYTTEDVDFAWGPQGLGVSGGGKLCIPADNVEGMLKEAARKSRQGKVFESAVLVENNSPLDYSGPKTVSELFTKDGFRDVRRVKLKKTTTILRTRPIIRAWSATVTIQYLKTLLAERDVFDALTLAGQIIGCGDYRPKFGRFLVEKI